LKTKYGIYPAISIVIANMIGTGIFTSLGFQVMELGTGFSLLMLWLIGGITALIGAMVYAELGSIMPRSGGEYHFLGKLYHPALGFVSGWVSFSVGFAAPVAAASMALTAYFAASVDLPARLIFTDPEKLIAVAVILLLSWLHARHKKAGAGFQSLFTAFKVTILILFILLAWIIPERTNLEFGPGKESLKEMVSAPFAIALFFVSFAYSGWNAAAYIAGEIRHPVKNIPISLVWGTLIVMTLYMGITWAFLKIIPLEDMQGKIEIGFIYGQKILGLRAGNIMGIIFSLLLLSSVSSLIITGPRVTQVMGEDYPGIRWFSKISRFDTPARAIYVQAALAIVYIISSTFEQMITYIGFTLNLMTLLTVLGLMLLRKRQKGKYVHHYRIRAYPWLPLIFLFVSSWIMVYGIVYRPVESLAGLMTAGAGVVIWFILRSGPVQPAEESEQIH
jgi:APA family basic amino acid/polyamine antiporter